MNIERSHAPDTDGGPFILLGDFTLLLDACVLLHKGEPSNLGRRAVAVLRELAKRPGEVVSKKQLLQEAWVDASGRRAIVEEGSLAVQIHSLRQALGKEAIKTVMDRGYRLMLPVGLPPAQTAHFPVPVTVETLIGREQDGATLLQWIRQHRITTLLGGPGVGKTSMASQVAGQLRPDRVCWLELAPLADEESLIHQVAAAARVNLTGQVTVDNLAAAMESASGLFVLDNAEHLLESVARLCAQVLSRSREVSFFVTSQAPLSIVGEHVYALAPLALPPDKASEQEILDSPAVALFMRVAERGDSEHRFTWPLHQVVHIVRMLAGNPLAIHHVAAHAPSLDPASLTEAWDALFQLSSANPNLPVRHRTLADAFNWSHNLLRPEARLVFHAIACFPAGVEITALKSLAQHLEIDAQAMQDAIRELVDRSFVFRRPYSQRLMIPEAARHYSHMRQEQGGEGREFNSALLERCLVKVVLEIANAGSSSFFRTDYRKWLAQYQPEWDNLRAALDTAQRLDLPSEILHVAVFSWILWVPDGRGNWALHLKELITPELEARASPEARFQLRFFTSLTLLDGGHRELLELPDTRERLSQSDATHLVALLAAASLWHTYTDPAYAEDSFVEAITLAQTLDVAPILQALLLQVSIYRAVAEGQLKNALKDAERALVNAEACAAGSRGFTLLMAVHAALAAGDVEKLRQHWKRTEEWDNALIGRQRFIILGWFAQGFAEAGDRSHLQAVLQGLVKAARAGLPGWDLLILESLAYVALQQGDEKLAARMLVRSDADYAARKRVPNRVAADLHARVLSQLPPGLMETVSAESTAKGRHVSTPEIMLAVARWANDPA
jgi:predicted ATPase/DNA-binding winged helix-turn-helix (wHTH) protein